MSSSVAFVNVRVFDGESDEVTAPTSVVVTGNTVAAIGIDPPADATRVDGGGGVLMPGLIDVHTHLAFTDVSAVDMMLADPNYLSVRSGLAARAMVLRGFTSVRDAGGPTFGIKRAIDEGRIPGPRIWPSGAVITQTGGHGDFRLPYETPRGVCGHLSHTEIVGAAVIADGVEAVLRGAREQLMHGASQIKMMAGGGVASAHDPLDVTQYTEAELRAGTDAAANWGTYVMVHAYTDRAVQQAIRAGVKCIEHGHLLSEETVAIMAENGIWWSMQPFLDDEDAIPMPAEANRAKQLQVTRGTDNAYELAKKYAVRLAWGTDTLFDEKLAERQGAQLAKMARWFSPAEVLRMATAHNGELLALSGPRSPYPGKLGVVQPGALADLVLVDGNPLENLDLITDPGRNFPAIMKDGRFVKNLV